MAKFPKAPKGVVRVTEYEIDTSDIFSGKRRSSGKTLKIKHHDMSLSDLRAFCARIGVPESQIPGEEEDGGS